MTFLAQPEGKHFILREEVQPILAVALPLLPTAVTCTLINNAHLLAGAYATFYCKLITTAICRVAAKRKLHPVINSIHPIL
jgi:hypothetical protein